MKDFDSIWRTQDEISENCPKDSGNFALCSCIELVKSAEIPNCCDVKCLADGISYQMVSQ